MSRDWKKISKVLSDHHESDPHMEASVLLSNPDLDIDSLPNPIAVHQFPEPVFVLEGEDIPPRDVRKFLWENRTSRAVTRDRAIVWSRYSEEVGVTQLGLGAVTHEDVIERSQRMNGNE